MYFAGPPNIIDTTNNGDNFGSIVGATVGSVIATLFVILVSVAILRYKARKTGLTSTSLHPTTTVAIPTVGGLTALLVYSHRLMDSCSRTVLGSEFTVNTISWHAIPAWVFAF